jgi:hypothetical protein
VSAWLVQSWVGDSGERHTFCGCSAGEAARFLVFMLATFADVVGCVV